MYEPANPGERKSGRRKRWAGAAGLLAVGAVSGGVLASALSASAATSTPAAGTVYRIETDAGDGVYEVHMKKADGSLVTVKFGKDLKVTKVEKGMGAGDPGPAGHGAGNPGPSGQGSPGSPA